MTLKLHVVLDKQSYSFQEISFFPSQVSLTKSKICGKINKFIKTNLPKSTARFQKIPAGGFLEFSLPILIGLS